MTGTITSIIQGYHSQGKRLVPVSRARLPLSHLLLLLRCLFLLLPSAHLDLDFLTGQFEQGERPRVLEVGLEELEVGALCETRLECHVALLVGMDRHQSPLTLLQCRDLLHEVRVAAEVHLEELELVDIVNGRLLQVLEGSAVGLVRMREEQDAALDRVVTQSQQGLTLSHRPHRLAYLLLETSSELVLGVLSHGTFTMERVL